MKFSINTTWYIENILIQLVYLFTKYLNWIQHYQHGDKNWKRWHSGKIVIKKSSGTSYGSWENVKIMFLTDAGYEVNYIEMQLHLHPTEIVGMLQN